MDNGTENAVHEQITLHKGIAVYFTHAHAPWQCGGIPLRHRVDFCAVAARRVPGANNRPSVSFEIMRLTANLMLDIDKFIESRRYDSKKNND